MSLDQQNNQTNNNDSDDTSDYSELLENIGKDILEFNEKCIKRLEEDSDDELIEIEYTEFYRKYYTETRLQHIFNGIETPKNQMKYIKYIYDDDFNTYSSNKAYYWLTIRFNDTIETAINNRNLLMSSFNFDKIPVNSRERVKYLNVRMISCNIKKVKNRKTSGEYDYQLFLEVNTMDAYLKTINTLDMNLLIYQIPSKAGYEEFKEKIQRLKY